MVCTRFRHQIKRGLIVTLLTDHNIVTNTMFHQSVAQHREKAPDWMEDTPHQVKLIVGLVPLVKWTILCDCPFPLDG